MTVLVTGGAGYIGSHMVLELVDAGERVIVLDNLSTGFTLGGSARRAARDRRQRRSGPRRAVAARRSRRRDHPFRRLDRGSGFGARSARLLSQQYGEHARADRMRGEGRRPPFHFFLDRRGLRQSGGNSRDGKCSPAADLAIRLVEADERNHAARRRPRARTAIMSSCATSTSPAPIRSAAPVNRARRRRI